MEETEEENEDHNNNPFVQLFTKKIIKIISEEVTSHETQLLIKSKIIHPLTNMIYNELYPYILAMIITIAFILLLSIMTFVSFVVYFLKKA